MSTPEQPETPQLTRKQLREIRNTGATPIVTVDAAPAPAPTPSPSPAPAPLPRPAEPAVVAEPPVPDASVDLGVAPLTRRQARQQELIRTASVPVITPDVIAANTVPVESAPPAVDRAPAAVPETPAWAPAPASQPVATLQTGPTEISSPETGPSPVDEPRSAVAAPGVDTGSRVVVNPQLGAELLGAESAAPALAPSFDELISRSSTGSTRTPNALIVSHETGPTPILAPIAATGELLVTGTLNLPEGLGSLGHAPGTTDGKEADAVLVDGELPAHSSPTPIAASAAVSTSKTSGEVIQPPTPEKGSKLMISLAITAGVLALALVGVLIVAIVTGVFQ